MNITEAIAQTPLQDGQSQNSYCKVIAQLAGVSQQEAYHAVKASTVFDARKEEQRLASETWYAEYHASAEYKAGMERDYRNRKMLVDGGTAARSRGI